MIPKSCKRLAEVDFPIAVVSKHSAREKSIRHGHPSTLHLWWARRPLAACRAMLLALLLPDPCDQNCPEDFRHQARKLLSPLLGKPGTEDIDLRQALLKFIANFAAWENSANPRYLEVARPLVKAAHGEEPPLVVDPFAGGGSIPLEALRLGCDAFASDLNPVACLILKVMLEDIPRHGPGLAEELRRVGKEIKKEAEKELSEFYPEDPDGARPIAYLWARTVRCEAPNCGAEIPLMRSFWLCKKANKKIALRYKVIRPKGEPPRIEFEVFKPQKESEVRSGTVSRAKASCPCCNTVLSPNRVRAQLSAQRGGADVVFDESGNRTGGARLLAVVTLKPGVQGRHYRLPTKRDYEAVWKAQQKLKEVESEKLPNGLSLIPDEPVDKWHHDVNRMPMYGMMRWGDLFAARQKLSLVTLVKKINILSDTKTPQSLLDLLALSISRAVDYSSTICVWHISKQLVAHTFGRQAIPITWDFCEVQILGNGPGNYEGGISWITKVIESLKSIFIIGQTTIADSCKSPLPDDSCSVWFTDPPYYDAIDYAYCSDFFFVWLKRTLSEHPLLRDPFNQNNYLTPKEKEIVVDSTTTKGHGVRTPEFYERSMAKAFKEGHHIIKDDGVGCVVFAHKTTEGWESLLSGMIESGWKITSSWPIATEMGTRLIARETASLATSIHLVCRPRPENAPVGDYGDVLRKLPGRVGDWMERLQSEGVRGADLVFACIGPALEIYSRYSKVETPEGRAVGLPEYLEKVWEVVGRIALEQILGTEEARARNSLAGALEEDARLTALFLWTLQSTNGQPEQTAISDTGEEISEEEDEEAVSRAKAKGFSLIFDIVRRFAQPLGIHLPDWEGRIIETKKGVVRLLSVHDRAKQLFGDEGARAVADLLEESPEKASQLALALESEEGAAPDIKLRRRGSRKRVASDVSERELHTRHEATTLDRVHASMLLQRAGRTNALRALLKAEIDRGPDFLRLANSLSALYPRGSEEKRLLDAMLLAVPR